MGGAGGTAGYGRASQAGQRRDKGGTKAHFQPRKGTGDGKRQGRSDLFLYLSSKTIYENDWERHPQRVLISLLFPIWHTAIVSVIHYHGVHTLSMLLSSTSLVSLCRCPTPYRVSANLQAGLSCTTKIVTLHGKVYRMANWP